MESQKTVCRLCLEICESFRALEGNLEDILNILLPKIDLTVVHESMVCTNCADMLIKCFDFKASCLYTHGYIVSLVNNKDDVKLDLKDVYLSNNSNSTGVPEDQGVCGFCISLVRNCSAIPLYVERGDVMLQKMIEQCIPELDLSIIEKPVICTACNASLENWFRFVTNCLIVDEKIKKYCETLNPNNIGRIKLSSLLQFRIEDVTSEDDNWLDKIKVERQLCEEGDDADDSEFGDIFKQEGMVWDESKNAKEVEHRIESCICINDVKLFSDEEFIPKNTLACKEDSNSVDVIETKEPFREGNKLKEENIGEVEDHQYIMKEEIEIKTDEADVNNY